MDRDELAWIVYQALHDFAGWDRISVKPEVCLEADRARRRTEWDEAHAVTRDTPYRIADAVVAALQAEHAAELARVKVLKEEA